MKPWERYQSATMDDFSMVPPLDQAQIDAAESPQDIPVTLAPQLSEQLTPMKPWERFAQAPVEEVPTEIPVNQPKPGLAKTILDQGLQGATFGFADEATDRIGAGIASLATGQKYGDLLKEARSGTKEDLARQLSERPVTSIASNLAGGVFTGVAGAATKPGAAIGNFLRSGNTAARVGKGALAGAGTGATYGYGSGEEGNRLEGARSGAILGGVVGGAVPIAAMAGSKLNTKTYIPNSDQVRKAAGEKFKFAEKRGGTLKAEQTNKFVDAIEGMKPQTEIGQIISGDSPFTKVVEKVGLIRDKPMTLQAAKELDEYLGDAIDGFTEMGRVTKQGQKLLDIQGNLRKMIDDADESMIEGGKEGFEAVKEARKLWATSYRLADIERIIQRAEMTDNPATAIKTGFKNLVTNPNKMRGYSKEEIKALEKAANSGGFTDILRTAGSRLIPIVTATSGAGLGATTAAQIGSMASRGAATRVQLNKAGNAAKAVAERSGMVTKQQRIPVSKVAEILKLPPSQAKAAMAAKPITEPQRLLPAPAKEFISSPTGTVRQKTAQEVAESNAGRQRAAELGLTSDIRRIVSTKEIRSKMGPVWDNISEAQQKQIKSQIDEAWKANKAPLNDLIEAAKKNAEELAGAKGEAFRPNTLGDALMNAKPLKKPKGNTLGSLMKP